MIELPPMGVPAVRARSALLGGLALAALSSCVDGGGGSEMSAVTVRDSAGIRIVENHGPRVSEPWRLSPEPLVEIASEAPTMEEVPLDPVSVFRGPEGEVIRSTPASEEDDPNWDPERPDVEFPTAWVAPLVADVFDEEGRYLGPVKFPSGDRVSRFGLALSSALARDHLWLAVTNEMGFPQVVRFRLEPM